MNEKEQYCKICFHDLKDNESNEDNICCMCIKDKQKPFGSYLE